MASIEDCPGSETFGTDVKAAWQVKRVSRRAMAEKINIDWRYLVNIEDDGIVPSLSVIMQLIKACGFPMKRYFNLEIIWKESELRQRVSHRLRLYPKEHLPIIEGAIDSAILIEKLKKNETEDVQLASSILLLVGAAQRSFYFSVLLSFQRTILRVIWGLGNVLLAEKQ